MRESKISGCSIYYGSMIRSDERIVKSENIDINRMYELCIDDLERSAEGDLESLKRAVYAVRWLEGDHRLLEPLLALLVKGDIKVKQGVTECLGLLKLEECVEPLITLIKSSFEERESQTALLREEAIRALGVNGHESALDFLEEIMYDRVNKGLWSEDERSLAVEALTSFALAGKVRALEIISNGLDASDNFTRELSRESMMEISEKKFRQNEGYHSFLARFKVEEGGEKTGD
jgi:hypothetical protein